ncbi:hypothetical protein ACJ73_08905 [Blastomyces percursus]|uniref:Uncharacterized protein n=1 Tax=Blastomyces percursus TaxID=1658174 RepID=A0A1J9PIA3_9EURO|nr:hypothetical protein ACJ73_08905 [Blastomyces percursus]
MQHARPPPPLQVIACKPSMGTGQREPRVLYQLETMHQAGLPIICDPRKVCDFLDLIQIADFPELSGFHQNQRRGTITIPADQSKSENDYSDWTDDECAVTDGSDSENDTRSLQKQTSILSMKLKGQKCPKIAHPLQVTQIRRCMLEREMSTRVLLGMLQERWCNEGWCVGTQSGLERQADQGWDEWFDDFCAW